MLYNEFDSHKNFTGAAVFKNKAVEKTEILKNLNPAFSIREYQKEALGRFYYYCEEYHQKQKPIHLMFNMATGSGKTLIMAADILYLYQKGYRNFIFFTRLGNIIQKTKDNFLNPLSKKYLFAEKIVWNGQEIKIREVENFEGVSGDDINILFTTTAGLHSRFNYARENVLTYEDFADKKIVLIADEAHNLSAETSGRHTQTEEEERRNWELTVMRILNANAQKENILLEFTATARLEQEYPEILEKYENKAIFRYDLKEYRLDGFSKDVRTIQINVPVIERAFVAIVISQYRRKVAEKHGIALKPVVMFKANRVTVPQSRAGLNQANPKVVVSSEFKEKFHQFINNLSVRQLKQLSLINDLTLKKAFGFFGKHKISLADLVEEIKSDFAPEKCLSVDENKDLEQKQILLNSLEDSNNEIRAVFATEKLNEGWDVLNLFDIVRLYNSRDTRATRPGKTTVQEAQLIGRGARYCPFAIGDFTELFTRKFDSDAENELRIIEQLYYHSVTNPRYIQELESVLKREGIMPSRIVQKEIKINERFKQTELWNKGYLFVNDRKEDLGENVFGLNDLSIFPDNINESDIYELPTREAKEKDVFTEFETSDAVNLDIREYKLADFGLNIVRFALSKLPDGRFDVLKSIFGNLSSITQFIVDENYLGGPKVKVRGLAEQLNNLGQKEKIDIALFALQKVLSDSRKNKKEYYGTKKFAPVAIKDTFEDKLLQLDGDSPRAQNMSDFDLSKKEWFAQNEIWGTSEEESFLRFIDEVAGQLRNKYEQFALVRNEQHFKIYSFNDGEAFAPDFVLFLREKRTKKELYYQVFIEPKGDQYLDADNSFGQSKEGWKQKFLIELENNCKIDFRIENKKFRLIGLPFYNEGNRGPFDEAFNQKVLNAKKQVK